MSSSSRSKVSKPFITDYEYIESLIDRETINTTLLTKFNLDNHKEIKWHHRCILLDWIMEVCFELGLKRQT